MSAIFGAAPSSRLQREQAWRGKTGSGERRQAVEELATIHMAPRCVASTTNYVTLMRQNVSHPPLAIQQPTK
jgi:hypothetical protein